jgi:hypothetical protein
VSDLQKLLEDGETQKALALVNEDEYAWEDLLGLLEGSDEDMQRSAFEIVSKTGDHPRLLEALPMLILGLSSDEDDICRYAAEAMSYMGTEGRWLASFHKWVQQLLTERMPLPMLCLIVMKWFGVNPR